MDDNVFELESKHVTEEKKVDKPYAAKVIKSMGLDDEDLDKEDCEDEKEDDLDEIIKSLKETED